MFSLWRLDTPIMGFLLPVKPPKRSPRQPNDFDRSGGRQHLCIFRVMKCPWQEHYFGTFDWLRHITLCSVRRLLPAPTAANRLKRPEERSTEDSLPKKSENSSTDRRIMKGGSCAPRGCSAPMTCSGGGRPTKMQYHIAMVTCKCTSQEPGRRDPHFYSFSRC